MRLILALLLVLFLAFAWAEEPKRNDKAEVEHVIILPSGSVHNGDFFVSGGSVEISGTVNGDVYVFAQQVVIDGVINGDLLGVVGSIDISGQVKSNCRVLAGQILISGEIGNNATVVAGNVQLLNSAVIGGNIVSVAGNTDLAGKIGADATIVASSLRTSSKIHHDLVGFVGQMRVTSRAVIDGNLEYRSASLAWIENGATICGKVIYHPSFVHELVEGTWVQSFLVGSKIVAFLMNFIYTFVIGVVLVKIFPKNLDAAVHALKKHPLKSLTYGIVLLILLPLASLIMLMTILGIPFALTLIALNIIGFYTAKVYCIFWISSWGFGKMKKKVNRLVSFFLGLIVYFCLAAIPIFGTVLAIVFMLLGLGAGVLSQGRRGFFNVQTTESTTHHK